MHSVRCPLSDRCSCLCSSIYPSRPALTAVTFSRHAQRHSHADAPDRPRPRPLIRAPTYLRALCISGEMHDRLGSESSLRPATRVRRGMNITSQQANRFPRTLWLMSLRSHHCSATNSESAPHLAAGVRFLGGSLRCLSVASTHATDHRCASVMLQHRNSWLSSRRLFHAKTVPAQLRAVSPSIDKGSTAIIAFALSREYLRILGRFVLGGWALRTSDRGGQDKSRKVRTVGWVENSAKFRPSRNIARVSRNLRLWATYCRRSTFDTPWWDR